MLTFYHGSPKLFETFELNNAGEGTGIKFGYGVYLTESEASAIGYSQPRKCALMPEHYLYTVEVPELTSDNHLSSSDSVAEIIIRTTEKKLGQSVPAKCTQQGKEFRKWLGCALTGGKKAGFAEEKAAAEFLDSIGVIANVWPYDWKKPDGLHNYAIFNPARVRIIKREKIEIENVKGKYILVNNNRKEV